MKSFRPDMYVLSRLIVPFAEKGSLTKTHLHCASRIRWDSFERYLGWLQSNGYIECQNNEDIKTYMLTASGREMFRHLTRFRESIQRVVQI